MAVTKINGAEQIQANTVAAGQVASSVLIAAGTNPLTANWGLGGFLINNLGTPSSGTDAATKAYVDAAINAASQKFSAVAGTNTETLTIVSGSVTLITGTTVNAISPNVNDYVLIPNAPASTGAAGGATLSSQPANGLYQVTNNTTNLTVARAADMSGTINPMGANVAVAGGALWGGAELLVTTPSTTAAFTYGSGNIAFTQMSGTGEITVDSTITKTGNQLSRPALTGDVTASTGSNATTIAAAAVTLAKQANLVANSVIGNNTGSSATPVAVPLSVAAGTPAASTIPLWDANKNLSANALIPGFTTQALSATPVTMTIASTGIQVFTGTTQAQTVLLPTTSVVAGAQYLIVNNATGTGAVTVQSSGANTITIVAPGTSAVFTAVVATPTTAANWSSQYFGEIITSGKALSVSNSLTLAGTDGTTVTFPPSATPVASNVAEWDANKGLSANTFVPAFTTTATAAGTTNLTIATATGVMIWTGATTQTITLPTTSVLQGTPYTIINQSSGTITIQSSGANTITTLTGAGSAPFNAATFIAVVATPTTAANWAYTLFSTGGGGSVSAVSVATANGFAGTSSGGATPALTLTTSITGVLKGNGTAISAATAGTDYMAPADFVTRETPGGTINGSTTAFTLANTPISGTEMVFLNGVLQESGSNDYSISTNTITFVSAPLTGDRLRVSYLK